MAISLTEHNEQLASRLAAEPQKEPRVDQTPAISDEESEVLSKELDERPIPFRHRRGGS